MNGEDKKCMLSKYKERKITGGIISIKNNINGKVLFEASLNTEANRNRFEFCKKTGSAISLKIQKDWNTYGSEAFTFEVLEELTKGENQTMQEFEGDVKVLKEIWLEKLQNTEFY